MEVPFAQQSAISAVESNVKDKDYDQAILALDSYFAHYEPSMCIPSCPDFHISSLDYTLRELFPLLECNSSMFERCLDRHLRHCCAMAESFCSREMMIVIQSIFKEANGKSCGYLVTSFARIVANLSYEEQVGHLPALQRYILNSPIEAVSNVPTAIWELMLENLGSEEISPILTCLIKSSSIEPALILTKKNPQVFVPLVLLSAELEYVVRFLHARQRCLDFDVVPLIARAVGELHMETSPDQKHAIRIICRLLDKVNEQNKSVFQPAWSRIQGKVEDPKCQYRDEAMRTLVKAESKGIVRYEKLKTLFDLKCPQQQKYILRAMWNHSDSELFDLLRLITGQRDQKALAAVIQCLIHNYDKLEEMDEIQTRDILCRAMKPFPEDAECQEALAELLLLQPTSYEMYQKMKEFIDFCLRKPKSERMVSVLQKLMTKYGIYVNYINLDWFGNASFSNLALIPEGNPLFVLELLSCHLVDPRFAHIVLDKLTDGAGIPEMALETCIQVLVSTMMTMGFNIAEEVAGLGVRVDEDEISWFDKQCIRDLFDNVPETLGESEFGLFVHDLLAATTKLASLQTLSDRTCALLMLICQTIGAAFPGSTAAIVSLLHDIVGEANQERHAKDESKYFHQFLPLSKSVEVAKAVVHCYGEEKAFADFRDVILDAVAKDAHLATQFQAQIDQPIRPMPTFLYFKDEKHKEWAENCRTVFSFNDWIVLPGDIEVIGELPKIDDINVLDEPHRMLYEHKECVEEPPIRREFELSEYRFEPVADIKKGLNMRESSDGSLYSTIAYLWHSKDPLPSAIAPEQLQSFVLEHIDDVRLVIGYLTQARAWKWQLDIEAWAKNLPQKDDDYWIYAAALFLDCVAIGRSDIPDYIKTFIRQVLDSIGLYLHDEVSIIHYLDKETGMRWQLIRSVIGLDVQKYSTYFDPYVAAEFMEPGDFGTLDTTMIQRLNCLGVAIDEMYKILHSLTIVFMFCPSDMKCNRMLPTNNLPHQRLLSFCDSTQMQLPTVFKSGMIDGILSTLSNYPYSECMFRFLASLTTTTEQFTKIIQMCCKLLRGREFFTHVLMNRDDFFNIDEVAKDFIRGRPPSYTRALFKALKKYWKSVITDKYKDGIKSILAVNPPNYVHPALCYSQMGKAGMEPWKSSTNLTNLSLGITDLATIMGAFNDMSLRSSEAVAEFAFVCAIDNETVQKVTSWKSAESMGIEFARLLLASAVALDSTVEFADQVFRALIRSISLVEITKIVVDESFLNNGKLACVTLIFRKLESLLAKSAMEEEVAACVKYHDPRLGLIKDAQKMQVFVDPNNPASIAASLTYIDEPSSEISS